MRGNLKATKEKGRKIDEIKKEEGIKDTEVRQKYARKKKSEKETNRTK